MIVAGTPRPRLREPGLLPLEPGTERYRVRGGGATVVALNVGDRITIIDLEGRQRCELATFSPEGSEDARALGARADSKASGLATVLANGGHDAHAVTAALGRRRIDAKGTVAMQLFGGETRPGDREVFTAERPVICVVVAPGEPMAVDEQDPPTDLRIVVNRAEVAVSNEVALPLPLADLRLDRRVSKATALAYEVRAGEYIQVIDLAGRQCSDFLAFGSRQLQYEWFYAGDPLFTRARFYRSPVVGQYKAMVEKLLQTEK